MTSAAKSSNQPSIQYVSEIPLSAFNPQDAFEFGWDDENRIIFHGYGISVADLRAQVTKLDQSRPSGTQQHAARIALSNILTCAGMMQTLAIEEAPSTGTSAAPHIELT